MAEQQVLGFKPTTRLKEVRDEHPERMKDRKHRHPRCNDSASSCESGGWNFRKGQVFIRRLRSMGIRDRPTAPQSPWQNGYCERLIGSIRRECLDRIVVFGERHLRHLLRVYADYYNRTRTHLSLNKDSPASRAVESFGRILPVPILGGLHHQYVRI
jgi:integrase-like protein